MNGAGGGNFGRVDIDVADVFCALNIVIFAITARLGVTKPKVREIVAVRVVTACGIKAKPFTAFYRQIFAVGEFYHGIVVGVCVIICTPIDSCWLQNHSENQPSNAKP